MSTTAVPAEPPLNQVCTWKVTDRRSWGGCELRSVRAGPMPVTVPSKAKACSASVSGEYVLTHCAAPKASGSPGLTPAGRSAGGADATGADEEVTGGCACGVA